MRRIPRLAALVVALTAAVTACRPPEGDNGLLTFRQEDPVAAPFGGMAPFALGIGVPVVLAGVGPLSPSGCDAAHVDPPDVATVQRLSSTRLVVTGRRAGEATLVVSTPQGEERTPIAVAAPARLVPLIADDTDRRVLRGGVERVVFRRVDASGETLAGLAPLTGPITPAGAAERVDGAPFTANLRHLAAGEHTLTVDGLALRRVVVEPDAVAAIRYGRSTGAVAVGARVGIRVDAIDADGAPLGALEGLLAVESTTPAVCAVEVGPTLGGAAITLTAHAAGDCALTSRLGPVERHDVVTVH